ncbi:hypothetical protein DL764_005592 [Monosporascus ibericus]|uniref:N-acetyltransferase domain-containing protein n=1 Tax=Monosporascus ibericus TaxID=155417 RepID=A0A4Q4T8I0_9PEZI|nr:hypothetical protein DL764_005592 [Monosporascus ibericus]
MSLPSTDKSRQQSSIRSFFAPKQPTYAPPPSSASTAQQQSRATPPPPPSATASQPSRLPRPNTGTNGASPPPSLHPQATISPILPEHIPALRRITSLLLPVNYPDSFWARLSDPQSSGAFSRVLLWTDDNDPSQQQQQQQQQQPIPSPKVIGGLVCRPEPSPFPAETPGTTRPNALYIQSLVLLSPYRSLGLAAALLEDVAGAAALSPDWACDTVWAHVWTDNAEGLRWYLARGFEREPEEVQGYYFKLRPDSAWIVRRRITISSGDGDGSWDARQRAALKTIPTTATTTATAMATIPPSITAAAANLPLGGWAPGSTSMTAPPVHATTAPPPPASRSGATSPLPSPGLDPCLIRGTAAPPAKGGTSYQNTRPETEWNDLPADMHASRGGSKSNNGENGNGNGNLGVPGGGSGASSRSSSAGGRRKRDRAYPAAAFGS